MTGCPHCGFETQEQSQCPSCGRSPEKSGVNSPSLIRSYFRDLWEIHFHPTRYFRRMPLSGGLAAPLTFAIVSSWIGVSISFLLSAGPIETAWLNDYLGPGEASELFYSFANQGAKFMKNVSWVILDPFITLASVLFASAMTYIGARIFVTPGHSGAPQVLRFEYAVRIICFGMAPAILAGIPWLGSGLSGLWIGIVTIFGAREVYRISSFRAILVALFPKLLFFGIILVTCLTLGLAVLKMITWML